MKFTRFIIFALVGSIALVVAVSVLNHGEVSAHTRITTDINWGKDIQGILEEKCMSCHHPGGLAPDFVDLTVYGTATEPAARGWAEAIKIEIITGRMPPWKPDGRFSTFDTNKMLTQEEKDIIIAWADGGAPQGPVRNIPMPEQFEKPFWPFGEPDMIFESDTPFTLAADEQFGSVTYTFPVELEEDSYITGYEFLVENPKNIHSIQVWLNDPEGVEIPPIEMEVQGEYDPLADEDDEETRMREMPKGTHIMGQWLPGDEPVLYPDAAGRYFRKDSTITMTIQFERPGFADWSSDVVDQSKLGLFVAQKDEEIDLLVESVAVGSNDFTVKAAQNNERVETSYTVKEGMSLIGLAPQLGPVPKDLEVSITYPDNRTSTLLWIPEFKQRWEATYHFESPIDAPVGSTISTVAHYDNSEDNWDNPNSPPEDLASGAGYKEAKLHTTIDYMLNDHLKVDIPFVPRERPESEEGAGMSIAAAATPDFLGAGGAETNPKAGDPSEVIVDGESEAEKIMAEAAEAMLADENIFWCPMRGNPCSLTDYQEPGTCDDCFMPLSPKASFFEGKEPAIETYHWVLSKAGKGDAFWCPNRGRDDHKLLDYYVQGRCEVCAEPLLHQARFKDVHTYTCMTPDCDNYQATYFGPGLCTSCGQPVVGLGHMDHTPLHGGWQFFMVENNYHHLEGTMHEEGIFKMYMYDDWKIPLDTRSFKASLYVETENEETGVVTETAYPLSSVKEGDTWLTAELPKEFPISFYVEILLPTKDDWQIFEEKKYDFRFEELTPLPDENAVSGDVVLHAHNCLEIVVPDTVEGIVQEIIKMDRMVQARIETKDWKKIHCPAV
ncbi:MAG TPA: cytochrome c, partial [Candidatus Hydrogenedentes bacterium]|nr:cytochrome c [Candidatus Hydrogenedentota bacterium]